MCRGLMDRDDMDNLGFKGVGSDAKDAANASPADANRAVADAKSTTSKQASSADDARDQQAIGSCNAIYVVRARMTRTLVLIRRVEILEASLKGVNVRVYKGALTGSERSCFTARVFRTMPTTKEHLHLVRSCAADESAIFDSARVSSVHACSVHVSCRQSPIVRSLAHLHDSSPCTST